MYPEKILEANKFIRGLAKIANFTENGTHGALTIFTEEFFLPVHDMLAIKFSEQLDLDDYLTAVNRSIKEERLGGTDIINALNVSLLKMFQNSNGMRENALQVAVLITDGDDKNPIDEYEDMAKSFIARKIEFLAVGVGKIDAEKLNKLVQLSKHFFKAEKFEDLLGNVTEVIGALICEGIIL